jgi:hypothetical protein
MKGAVWQIAAGVFIGNAVFALLAWFFVSIAMENARYNQIAAGLPAQEAETNAALAEACARYKAALKEKADPNIC